MMVKFFKLLPKKDIILYIIFALLYSCQGIVIPVIIQMAGHIDSSDSWDLIVFTFSSISLWVVVYAFMYIENILLRSIIRAFNVSLSALLTLDTRSWNCRPGVPPIFSYLASVGRLCPSICNLSAQTKYYCRESFYCRCLSDDFASVYI